VIKCVCGLLIVNDDENHCPRCGYPGLQGRKVGEERKKKTVKELMEELRCRRGS
jgi:primosomal protein N'